jgi:hypothetical protein
VVATAWPDALRPLSANQEQMWVLYKSGGQTSAYNIPLGLTLEGLGGVDMAALQRALDAVAQRHETLRCGGGWAVALLLPALCLVGCCACYQPAKTHLVFAQRSH